MKKFTYNGTQEDVKNYLSELGYSIMEVTNTSGVPIGFDIIGTTIRVGYKLIYGRWIEGATISMLNDQIAITKTPDLVNEGNNLYKKLYKKFNRRI